MFSRLNHSWLGQRYFSESGAEGEDTLSHAGLEPLRSHQVSGVDSEDFFRTTENIMDNQNP